MQHSALVCIVLTLFYLPSVFAHEHARSSVQFGISVGHSSGHFGHRRYAHHGHGHRSRHGGSVSVYVPVSTHHHRRRERVLDTAMVVHEQRLQATRSRRLPDMPMLTYVARNSQDSQLTTRDRRQCERIAWRQTRADPRSGRLTTLRTERVYSTQRVYNHGDVLHPAAGGALLGAVGGAIAGDVGAGAAIGAIVGVGSWLLSGGAHPHQQSVEHQVQVREYLRAAGPQPQALRAALSTCMQGRGYKVS